MVGLDILKVDDLKTAITILTTLSYGDRAGAAMLFDVCMNGPITLENVFLGGSVIWRVKHHIDKQNGKLDKQLKMKDDIASHLAKLGLVNYDRKNKVIQPCIKEIIISIFPGSNIKTIGPSPINIYNFLRGIIPKATSEDKGFKVKRYLMSSKCNFHILLPVYECRK